jgi:hypothetical protein
MAFYLTVTSGPDEGKTARVEVGECVLGRAPSSTIPFTDASVAWEHLLIRSEGDRLFVQNLSASGARIKGSRVDGEVRISSNEEVELSDSCRVLIQQRLGGPVVSKRTRGLFLGLGAVVLVVAAASAYLGMQPSEPPLPPITEEHYHTAFVRLDGRLEEWVREGSFPAEALTLFRDAWRLELAFNPEQASEAWGQLRSLLLTLPVPGPFGEGKTMAEAASPKAKVLGVIMDWDPRTSMSTDPRWTSDPAFADALTWFVRKRYEITREQAEEGRR